ncbi:hypothetical protein BH10PSE12_BH10PSE12_37780 [soil metagenome]
MLHSAPAHSLCEIRAAERAGADIVLVSPVFSTRSHPGAPVLGRVRFGQLARQARRPVIALGGMTAERATSLSAMTIHGWAAIDALICNAAHKIEINQDQAGRSGLVERI